MPKLERLEWLAPLSEGRGVTLSDDPAADLLLAEDPNALILGVLFDSQFLTRKAFSAPLKLKERMGNLNMFVLAEEDTTQLVDVFSQKPALHRFPRKFAGLTQQLALAIVVHYDGDSSRMWTDASGVEDLGSRILALPAFGVEKTNWSVGMLGKLGLLLYGGWEEYRVAEPKRSTRKAPA
ncbi:MAG: HhH-GPD-type base excision DNA repair protein [Chloroflexota bacterium]|nr:MAG: Fe-S cluster assembly protein HesB [Chloroflexota bacterium]